MEKTTTKMARTEPGIEADDRLSSLPDEVISHILSSLPTKYAVLTAVLGRRWKDLWTRVSNLDLDNLLVYRRLNRRIALRSLPPDEQLKYQGGKLPVPDPVSVILRRRNVEFCRFVDKVMSQHKNLNSLRRFRFHLSVDWDSPYFYFEMELLFGPLLEQIDVMLGETEFGFPQSMRCLPQSFYALKNLEMVKLTGITLSAANESIFFPRVKFLQLCWVKVHDFETLGRLLSGCPALETAHLVNCFPSDRYENDIIDVALPCLKNLKIYDYPNYHDDIDDAMVDIVIEAPKLEDLSFVASTNLQLGGRPFPRLHSAHVDISGCGNSVHSLIKVLTRISNAREMSLSRNTLTHLSFANDVSLPDFPNMTHLTIQYEGYNWVLHCLLHSASKLHSLVINMVEEIPSRAMEWEILEHLGTPECLISSLEEITVKNLGANEDKVKMLSYLLQAGVFLKRVNMHVRGGHLDKKGRESLVSLLKLSRKSTGCKACLLLPNYEEICIDSDDETAIDEDMVDDQFDEVGGGQHG